MRQAPIEKGALSLATLFEQIEGSDNPELALLQLSLEAAGRRHPNLPEALKLAAIPRRFDRQILAVLRGEDEPGDETRLLLQELEALPLVHSRGIEVWSVNDTTRELLLSEWRQPATRDDFDQHNEALSQWYQTRHERVVEDEQMLGWVAGLLRRVSPERHAQLITEIQGREVTSLLEALYHETLKSPQAGYEFFQTHFDRHESLGRAAICESLVLALRDYIARLPAAENAAPLSDWLRYYEARLANRMEKSGQALDILEAMRGSVTDDKLILWVLTELGVSYSSEHRYPEARDVLTEELTRAIETQRDPINIPVSISRLASLHAQMFGLDEAVRLYQEAIQAAAQEQRPEIEVNARLELSRNLYGRGDAASGLKEAIRALDLARRQHQTDVMLHSQLCDLFMYLLARQDPSLLDTLIRERRELLATVWGKEAEAVFQLDMSYYLNHGGQIRRGLSALQQYEAEGKLSAGWQGLLQLRLGVALEELGRLTDASAAYTRLIEDQGDKPSERFNVAAALANRGLIHRDTGAWPAALRDYGQAYGIWNRMGFVKMSALMQVLIAATEAAAARASAIEGVLEERKTPASSGFPALEGELHFLRGELEAAREVFTKELSASEVSRGNVAVAMAHGWLAIIAGATADWSTSAQHAMAAGSAWRRVGSSADGLARTEVAIDHQQLRPAQLRIDAARRHIDSEVPYLFGELWRAQADVHHALGHHEQSYACLLLATSLPESVGDRNDIAVGCLHLSREAGYLGRAPEAAQHADRAARIWKELARTEQYATTAEAEGADGENSRGMVRFVSRVQNRAESVRTGHDLFDAAARLVPANWWYPLNLSYACAELGKWDEAASALKRTLDSGPSWLRQSVLPLRLAGYRVEEAQAFRETSQLQEASHAMALAVTELQACDSEDPDLLVELSAVWTMLGDSELLIGRYEDADSHYCTALGFTETSGATAQRLAELHGRRAFAAARLGHLAAGVGRMRLASELLAGAGEKDPYQSLTYTLWPLLRSVDDHDCLAEVLRVLSEDSNLSPPARRDVIQAHLHLSRQSPSPLVDGHGHVREGATPATSPVVDPTALAAHPDLFPEGEEWAPNHALFTTYLPAMRGRIADDLGVRVPGVRVRADRSLPPATYVVLLDEIPTAAGQVELGQLFCPQPELLKGLPGLRLEELKPAPNPHPGEQNGVWVPGTAAGKLSAAGIACWDHLDYIVRRLEGIQRRNITRFFGLQEMHDLLEDWKASENLGQREER